METTNELDEPGLTSAESKEAITSLVRELIDEAQQDFIVDRRRDRRYPLFVPVTVTPVGEASRRLNSTFVAVTRDVSAGGISFLHTSPVDDHYLYLRFTESRLDAAAIVIEVLRRRQVGPLWDIAGKFLPLFR
jgi:hypothetical protein